MKYAIFGTLAAAGLILLGACGPAVPGVSSTTTNEVIELGNDVSDVASSVDESGGSTGNLAFVERAQKSFARLVPAEFSKSGFNFHWIADAQAAICSSAIFGACTANSVVRNYAGCTVDTSTFTGTVAITWGGASIACHPAASGDTITRVPSFQITGPQGSTYSVTNVGAVGQQIRLTNFAASATRTQTFTSDGIRRIVTSSTGTTLYDTTQSTTAPITITGTTRTNRTMNGGTVRIQNNLTGTTCDFSPTLVSWTGGCNCPTSGSWAGTCTDGRTSTILMTACGFGTVTLASGSEDVHFDRCL